MPRNNYPPLDVIESLLPTHTWVELGQKFGINHLSLKNYARRCGLVSSRVYKRCTICDQPIVGRLLTVWTCSDKCNHMLLAKHARDRRAPKKKRVTRLCDCGCGVEFTSHGNKVYLNRAHKVEANRLIDRAMPYLGERSRYILQELACKRKHSKVKAKKRYLGSKTKTSTRVRRTKERQ